MTIILDAMGSDKYPIPEIEGAMLAAQQLGIEIIMVGNTELIKKHLPTNFDLKKWLPKCSIL